MTAKDSFTKVFLKAADEPTDKKNVKKHKNLWWWNFRSDTDTGLRLTDAGLEFVEQQAKIRVYKIELPIELKVTPQVLVWLNQQLDSPYHLTNKHITVLKEKAAFEIYLFSGDIRKMGYSKSIAKRFNSDL